ncbi:MAG: hypothetical protein JWQ18_3816 [Conexibacter sp.]|nr:hypothetical protein [Conexibacter sp.]
MRIRMSLKPVVAAAVTVGALALSSSAMAVTPQGQYAPYKYCPYTNTNVISCVLSKSTSGSIKLGNATVPLSAATPITLQGGFGYSTGFDWYNAVGADTLVKQKLKVPGGLIGLVSTGGFSGLLIDLFNAAVASVNDVYATAELAGSIQFNYLNFALGLNDPAVVQPIRVHLENPFLGSNCYIGSTAHPIVMKLTTGTTAPPAGVTPLVGSPGVLSSNPEGTITTNTGVRLVDNSFAVPAASDCGYLPLDKLVITAAVNLKEGLPSAAGNNVADLRGTANLADRAAVQASAS